MRAESQPGLSEDWNTASNLDLKMKKSQNADCSRMSQEALHSVLIFICDFRKVTTEAGLG